MNPKSIDVLQRLTAPQPFPPGMSEAEMAARIERRKTIAKLVAAIRPNSQPVRERARQ